MSKYQLESPGKLLRPALCLWAGMAAGGRLADAMPGALAVEWVHNFTLVHDDVQDRDRLRRHRPTVWAVWGEAQAINAGDFMSARAIELLSGPSAHPARRLRAVRILTRAVQCVVEGQCLDLLHEGRPGLGSAAYLRMVRLKTGALIGASLAVGASLAGDARLARHLGRAGELLGLAFQVRDDWLGTWGDHDLTGKPTGDLARRKATYPVLAAYAVAAPAQRRRLSRLFAQRDAESTVGLRELLLELGGPGLTEQTAQELSARAMGALEQIPLPLERRLEFTSLARFLARRTS